MNLRMLRYMSDILFEYEGSVKGIRGFIIYFLEGTLYILQCSQNNIVIFQLYNTSITSTFSKV